MPRSSSVINGVIMLDIVQQLLINSSCVPQGGFSAGEMLRHAQGADPARRERLIRVLDIDPAWHMNNVSDGQRRRVQIAMGLLRPFKVRRIDMLAD